MSMRREFFGSQSLLRRVAPLVLLAVIAKLVVHAAGWDTLEINPLVSALVTATVFLLGFLLAGTLVDYKESERLPGDLASALETIADECVTLHEAKGEPAATRCVRELQGLARDITEWLHDRRTQEDVLLRLDALNHNFLELEPLIQGTFLNRLKLAQADSRKMVIRIGMVHETSFVMAGYAIAQTVSVLLVAGLLFVNITPLSAGLFLIGMISFFFAYMIFLIADIDDPFDYAGPGPADAEVSLKALDRVEKRLAAAVGELEHAVDPVPAVVPSHG